MLIDFDFLDTISSQAQGNERLRQNYNLHESLDSGCQRMFNALEPGTRLPIHRHPLTDETYILLRGRIDTIFCDENGVECERFHLNPLEGRFGVHIPKGQWHTLEVLESGSVIFETKEGPYTPLSQQDILSNE